jgi:hypothetical protein
MQRSCPYASLTKHYTMKAYGGVDVQTAALVGGEWPASRPGRFTPGRGPVRIG